MSSKQKIVIIVISVLAALLLDVLFGSYLRARIQNISFVKHLRIYTPDAPVVIEKKEQVIVKDQGDITAALETNEPYLATVYVSDTLGLRRTGNAAFVTREGMAISVKPTVATNGQIYLRDYKGKTFAATLIASDPISDLVFLKTSAQIEFVPEFIDKENIKPGLKVAEISMLDNSQGKVTGNYVTQSAYNVEKGEVSADVVARYMELQQRNPIEPGTLAVTHDGLLVGIYNTSIIPASTISSALRQVIAKSSLTRPAFGFSLKVSQMLTSEKQIQSVIMVGKGSTHPELKENDIITKINGNDVTVDTLYDKLSAVSAGDTITLNITRGSEQKQITIKTGALQ